MPAFEKQRILIVDDDEHLLKSLCDFLESEDYFVETANSGEMALQILEGNSPHLIILDICMPGMSGIGFLKAMAGKSNSEVPVLVHSVRSNLETFIGSLHVGGFIPKPCETAALLKQIRCILPPVERPLRNPNVVNEHLFFSVEGHEPYHMERSLIDAAVLKYHNEA